MKKTLLILMIFSIFIVAGCTQTQPIESQNTNTDSNNQPTITNDVATKQDSSNDLTEQDREIDSSKVISNTDKIKVISEEYWGSIEDIQLYNEQGSSKVKEALPCDHQLSISKEAASILYVGGQLRDTSGNSNYNSKTFVIEDNEIEVVLIEAHSSDPKPRKTLCTYDESSCQDENDWAVFEINGYETEIVREEIKTFTFDNNLKINFGLFDDDVDICIKIFK